ncbi:MAG: anaerobic ribonucleoside triphosphate reductase [Firmicutes bacterium]|nr:anaerobic ribonucleoside triphosphate reductase [Bacillota bacterium]
MSTLEKETTPFPVIRKRDGRLTRFDIKKIANAIHQAFFATGIDNPDLCKELADTVVKELLESAQGNVPQVEDIQDAVERILIRERYDRAAKAFILYRAKRTSIREGKSELLDSVETILTETRKETPQGFNSASAKMMKISAAASRAFYLTRIIPSQFSEAHNRGDIHIHDLDYYSKTLQSLQIPLFQMLENGFSSGFGRIRNPKHISTIGALTAIIIQSCQNDMHGGQCIPAFDEQIARYLRNRGITLDSREVRQTMQGLVYNLNMMYSRMGEQVPMSTINIGLDTSTEGRMITDGLLSALEEGLGCGETPIYPWVVFHVKEGVNFNEGDPNHDLLHKAVRVSCRRMNPVFAFEDAPINKDAGLISYQGTGERNAANTPFYWDPERIGELTENRDPWGWGSIAQVTVNLPRVAFKIAHKRKDFLIESYYSEIRRSLEIAARQLAHRRDVLSGLHASEIPFVMGEKLYRGSNGLSSGDSIEKALQNGINTIGFAGLAESLFILYGKSYGRDEKLQEFALEVVDYMVEKVKELSREFEATFVLSASSSGYAAHRFPILDRAEFSAVPFVTDKKYYNQGFSLQATEEIPWETKLEVEGKFHNKVQGGHFTFLESEEMPTPPTYFEVLRKMKESGIALGGISFPLVESLEDGSYGEKALQTGGKLRKIRRAAGMLMPLDHINDGLKDELERRHFDLRL